WPPAPSSPWTSTAFAPGGYRSREGRRVTPPVPALPAERDVLQIRRRSSNLRPMWDRLAAARLRRLWRQFPAVLILGARQVGKTTLARQTFPRLPYVDLEEPRSRERQPGERLARQRGLADLPGAE